MNKKTNTRLLASGVIAGPLFIVSVAVQAVTRDGFNLTKQAASLLTLGSLGWVQSATFIVTGALLLAYARGVQVALDSKPGGTWTPRLLYLTAGGLGAGGVFHPDAGDGYPQGTPTSESVVRSWHGILHMVCGFTAFLSLIVACFVLARYFKAMHDRRSAVVSRVAGAVFAVCVVGANGPDGSLTLFVGAAIVLIWLAFVARRLAGLAGETSDVDARRTTSRRATDVTQDSHRAAPTGRPGRGRTAASAPIPRPGEISPETSDHPDAIEEDHLQAPLMHLLQSTQCPRNLHA